LKHYLPKNAEDASALILTLLVIVLLSTVVTSFLSSTRTEQTATRNYTSKTQAEQFATSATQQAMATLQAAFNGNGNGTAIVTSQPGGITKYFFKNGTCTQNPTANLFFTATSTNANGTVNMNNLDNSTNSTISGLITGNSSEAITVARVEVKDSSGNQTIGRIAYYIDDEGTKINLNSLAGNKTTLNAGYGKTQSLSGVVSSTINGSANFTGNLTVVDAIINGTASSNNTSITNWTSFFRTEQAQVSLSINASQIKHYSTAPPSDFHLKYTPWGTQRLFINDEPVTDNGVTNVFSTLSGRDASGSVASASSTNPYEINGMALRNIFNGTFSDKYSINGTLQIAANMLQLKDKNTVGWNWKNWTGQILGSANLTTSGIPQSYFAYIPPVAINEVAIQPEKDITNGRLFICIYIEMFAPLFDYGTGNASIILNFQGATFNSGNTTVTFPADTITRNITYSYDKRLIHRFEFSQPASSFNGTLSVTMGDIRLLANSQNNSSIRDWLTGDVTNSLLPISSLSVNSTAMANYTASAPWNTSANLTSIQRKDIRLRQDSSGVYSALNNSVTSPWGVKSHTLPLVTTTTSNITSTGIPSSCDINSGDNPQANFATASVRCPFTEWGYRETGINSSDWPSDHQFNSSQALRRYYSYQYYAYPFLDATDATGNGLYIRPADLGKVMTDRNFRSLRTYYQPPVERARGFIPDWALLDVVSFSSNNSSINPYKIAPLNLNGRFNCLPSPSSQPTPVPRNNIQCLTKPFDASPVSTASKSFYGNPIRPSISLQQFSSYMPIYHWGWFPTNVGVTAGASLAMSSNLTQHITSNSSNATIAWSQTTGNNTWRSYRATKGWPSSQIIIPSEVTEIKQIADYYPASVNLTNPLWDGVETSENNENRLAAFFPGLTLCSNFFTIYAYAQALDKSGNVDSEHLTKTLVEVEITTPATTTTSAVYKVKSLYTQSIPMGD
jgi:Tfp pilus assembly protein PilX